MADLTPDADTPPRRGRGRRPADQVRAEILTAAGTLLLAEGMAGFTIEKVAAHAGASRMTIYKWWPSRGALALDGYFTVVAPTLAFADTADIVADLTNQLVAFVHLVRDTSAGRVISQLIGQAQTDPELAAAYRERYSAPAEPSPSTPSPAPSPGAATGRHRPRIRRRPTLGRLLPPASHRGPAAHRGLRPHPGRQPHPRAALTGVPVASSLGRLRPDCSLTRYAAYQSGQFSSRSPVRFSCSPWAAAARRSALARSLAEPNDDDPFASPWETFGLIAAPF
ncbi:TetR/AcrR family transcriptional regulator [Micromonospora sp. M12]